MYRILVVDDEAKIRLLIRKYAEFEGHEVTEAENGMEAVRLFRRTPDAFDIVIMDVMMPVMDGLEATKAIRMLEREDAKKIPIIAMTANAFAEDVQLAKNTGMNEHIAKPLDLNKLNDVLKQWL